MVPKQLLSVETLEKKRDFFDKFGVNIFPDMEKLIEEVKASFENDSTKEKSKKLRMR